MRLATWFPFSLASLLVSILGCGTPKLPDSSGQRCRVDGNDNDRIKLMVVDWWGPDRTALEAEAQHQIVVVSYRNCELEVLSRCGVPGTYELTRTTTGRDYIDVRTEDELFATLPFGAVKFSGEVRAGNSLRLESYVIGQRRASTTAVDASQLGSHCADATHFVSAMIIGASALSTVADESLGAGTGFVGGKTSSSSRRLASNGRIEDCETGDDPGTGCQALIRLDLEPIDGTSGRGVVAAAPASPVSSDVSDGVLEPNGTPLNPPGHPQDTKTIGTRSHEEKDEVLACEDLTSCQEKVGAQTKRIFTWERCETPSEERIVFDKKYTVRVTDDAARIEQNGCVCPEGFQLSKAWRIVNVRKAKNGTRVENYGGLGVCLPTNVEPNADLFVEGLTRLVDFVSRTNVRLDGIQGSLAEIIVNLDGHARQLNLNATAIKALEGRVDRHRWILESVCADAEAPRGVKDLCDAIQERARDRQITVLGISGTISRYPGRTHFGAAVEGGLITPPLSEGSLLRLEFGGRLGVGSSGEMKEDRDSALGFEGTIYGGPVFDLDKDGQYKLHLRGMGQQLLLVNGFKAMGRRYGGEVAFSLCPGAEAMSQGSFCVVPHTNLTHGASVFPRTPTEDYPDPPMRGESGVSMGGGFGITGQF